MDTDWLGGVIELTSDEDYLDKKTEFINLVRFTQRLAEEKELSEEQVGQTITMNTLRAFPKLAAAFARS